MGPRKDSMVFDVKNCETKDEMPPGACRPLTKLKQTMSTKWTTKKFKKNNVEEVCSYMLIYLHIPPYTFMYLHIPPNSFIYPHIHQNIEYWQNDGQHKTQKWS